MSQLTKSSSYTLNNGLTIPITGFGLFRTEKDQVEPLVHEALKTGYRHFDTAKLYENELETSNAIASYLATHNDLKRSDIFYTTKIYNDDHGYEETKKAVDERLKLASAIEYIDLILIHSPMSNKEKRLGSWKALQEAVESGKVKSIGVSNYGVKHLEELFNWDGLKIKPVVNQLELQPWLPRKDIQEFAKTHDLILEAYAPLTRGKQFNDPELVSIAEKLGKTPGEVLLRWSYDQGFVVLAKTATLSRIAENFNVLDHVVLDQESSKLLEKPDSYQRFVGWDPTTYEDPDL